MNKIFISALALAMPALTGMAVVPVKEEQPGKGTVKMQKAPALAKPKVATGGSITFFEGFEGRPSGFTLSQREWLPDGWEDVSKAGLDPTIAGNNITWQTIDNEYKNAGGPVIDPNAYEGEIFAYIMSDVAYPGHEELLEQDEWLITPSITPVGEDWFYFKLWFHPGWVLYNREANDFTGQNNSLEVYVTEDNGETWTKLWSLIDDEIRPNYSEEELRADLSDMYRSAYTPIYVDIKPYLNKNVRFAFRYFGRLGQAMAIDNVIVGVPQPVSSYEVPAAALRQGFSPKGEYPVDPRLYIPSDTELKWNNTSVDVLRNEWTYSAADGSVATSGVRNLTTPAYSFGTEHATPSLQGFFESQAAEPYQVGFSKMQAGGTFIGKDDQGYEGEFGTCWYDLTDPTHRVAASSSHIALGPDVDESWETLLGRLPGTLDVEGILNYYPVVAGHPYGFDYVDVLARVVEDFDDDARLYARVFALDTEGAPIALIGETYIQGSDLPKSSDNFEIIRFNFDVPVYAGGDYYVLISNPCHDADGNVLFDENNHISFAYMRSQDESIIGNSFLYMWMYDETTGWIEQFGNLNSFPTSNGHFAGVVMNIGSSYSWMERLDNAEISVEKDGGEAEFTVKAFHKPERWALTLDGVTVPDWLTFDVVSGNEDDVYTVKLHVGENPFEDAIDAKLMLMSPGSYVTVDYRQPGNPASAADAAADACPVKVSVSGDDIVVIGGEGNACVYTVSGMLVAKAALNGATTVIPASHLEKGVYVVSVDGAKNVKVVK